ncbi:hypothetical protein GCM10009804_08960 [Kribbella hippodromi]|uniref:Aminoglycoside phosphotransferase domain-containing protein n=1 Tax=Kribbella hippodromi TaxID=434347 RepID=A0ABP4N6L8_9ACTN
MNWQPSPAWKGLTNGTGQANGGVWRTPDGTVVKRLIPGVRAPRHHAYWERQALVAESGIVARTPGLHAPECLGVERDDEGITLRTAYTPPAEWSPEALAEALGRFAASGLVEPSWGARNILRDRLRTVEQRGGWAPLIHAGLAPPAVPELWHHREAALATLDALPKVPTHGDAHPANLPGRDGADVIAIDWEQFGLGPTGFDLAYLALAVDVPLQALAAAHGETTATDIRGATYADSGNSGDLLRGATLVAAYTAISRAAWSLTQPNPGDHLHRLTTLSTLIANAPTYI